MNAPKDIPIQHATTPVPIDPTIDGDDLVSTADPTDDEKEIRKDPTYKCRKTLANSTRRTTRATRDPATPHCSLITSIVNNSNS